MLLLKTTHQPNCSKISHFYLQNLLRSIVWDQLLVLKTQVISKRWYQAVFSWDPCSNPWLMIRMQWRWFACDLLWFLKSMPINCKGERYISFVYNLQIVLSRTWNSFSWKHPCKVGEDQVVYVVEHLFYLIIWKVVGHVFILINIKWLWYER